MADQVYSLVPVTNALTPVLMQNIGGSGTASSAMSDGSPDDDTTYAQTDGSVNSNQLVSTISHLIPAISAATNATPIVITTAAKHGLTTGINVFISGITGNTNANGIHNITVLSSTTFSLNGSAGNGTAGGTGHVFLQDMTQGNCIIRQLTLRLRTKQISGTFSPGAVTCHAGFFASVVSNPNNIFQTPTGSVPFFSSFSTNSIVTALINPYTNTAWQPSEILQQGASVIWTTIGYQDVVGANVGGFSSLYIDVYFNVRANITALAATSSTTGNPQFSWAYNDPEKDSQVAYQVKVFTTTQANPDTAVGASYDSGVVNGGNPFHAIPLASALTSGTYQVYVKVMDNGSGLWSAWGSGTSSSTISVTLVVDAPAVPAVSSVTPDSANQRVTIALQGQTNLLTEIQSSLESGTTGWAAGANTTIAQSATKALDGTNSLRLTPGVSGTITASTPTGISGVPVTPLQTYEIMCFVQGAIARVSEQQAITVLWWQAGGAASSHPSDVSTLINTNSASWVQSLASFSAPADAAFASLTVTVTSTQGSTDLFYVDEISLAPGTSTIWSLGGYMSTQILSLQRSIDSGVTWSSVRSSPYNDFTDPQKLTIQDYDVDPGASVVYRASATATRPSNSIVYTSAWSVSSGAQTVPTPDNFCLIDPITPANNVLLVPVADWKRERMELGTEISILGRTHKVFVSDTTLQGEDGSLTLNITSAAQMAAIKTLVETQHSLILSTPYGDLYYIRFVKRPRDTKWTGSYAAGRQFFVYGPLSYIETDAP